MSTFLIQPLTDDHLPGILRLYHECEDFLALGPVPQASEEMVRVDMQRSREQGGEFLGIRSAQGELAGVLDFIPAGFEGHSDQAFVELLMISPRFRGQDLGRWALAWLEDRIRPNPAVTHLLLGVQVNNPQAIRFWQACGFQRISQAALQPDGTLTCLYSKPLKKND